MTKNLGLLISAGFKKFFQFLEMILAWLLIPLGLVVTVKSEIIVEAIGDIDWCEQYIGSGGTYTFVKLFGIGISILSIMWLTGAPQSFLQNSFGRFF